MRSEGSSGKLVVLLVRLPHTYLGDVVCSSGFCVFSKPSEEGSGNFLSCPHPFNLLPLEKVSLP